VLKGFGYVVFMQDHLHPNKQSGFTLAELLMAIVIIGIMFAIALPSLTSLTGQSKLDSAANAVHSAAKLARQFAVTHNQPTYLVFNEGQTGSNLAYRAYSIFTINIHSRPTGSASVPREAGSFLKEWELLPAGIVFDDQSDSLNNLFNVDYSAEWNGALSEQNELRIDGADYVVAGFSPKGATSITRTWNRRLLIAEEFYNPAGGRQGKEIQLDVYGSGKITDLVYDEGGHPREMNHDF